MRTERNARRQIFFIGSVILSITMGISGPAWAAVPTEYCSTPPFMSNTVPPNVLIVLDNSLSMNDAAYSGTYDTNRFDAADSTKKGYYGYFEPGKTYQYSGTEWRAYTGTPPQTADTNRPTATGDFLNWATMRRIDIGRKLLIGGKATPRSSQPGSTVALYGETAPTPRWDFAKSDNTGQMSGFPVIRYDYEMRGDKLYVRPNTNSEARLPNSYLNQTWSYYPDASNNDQEKSVDDKNINEDMNYIYITSGAAAQVFGYDVFTSVSGTLESVSVRYHAKKSRKGTCRLTGVLRIDGTDYYDETSYDNLDRSWDTYQFTWTANPKRFDECKAAGETGTALTACSAWQASDLTDTASAYHVSGFGIYNVTNADSDLYPFVTWIELTYAIDAPAGGPYNVRVDWKGEDWAYEQGIIANLGDEARFGLGFYNSDNQGGHVENIVNFEQKQSMITTVHNLTPATYTPLSETLFEMVRYFRQDAPYYRSQDFTVGYNESNGTYDAQDPFYYVYPQKEILYDGIGDDDKICEPSEACLDPAYDPQLVPCAKSFILMLTDGEPTRDTDIPTTATGVPDGKELTDYDGDGNDPGSYNTDGSDYLDDVALWARATDARPGTCSMGDTRDTWTFPCLPGSQNIMIYSVFMFGKGSNLLKDAAVNGGFVDLNRDGLPSCDSEPRECYRETTKDGTLDSNDLPITYFEGDDGYELEQSITDAITSILRRAASGTAVSVLTTSSKGVGSMLQAYFHPRRTDGSREISWTGYVQNLWLDNSDNLREDTNPDLKLKLGEDRALKLYFDTALSETMVGTFRTDADGRSDGSNGTLDSCVPEDSKQFMDIQYLWEGGEKLALKAPSERSIFTSKKSVMGSTETVLDTSTSPKEPEFQTTMSATLKTALNSDATYTADNIIRYIRGECLETNVQGDTACGTTINSIYRDRRISISGGDANGNVWKLGDVINSTPKVFSDQPLNTYHNPAVYGDETYDSYISTAAYRKRTSAISSTGFIGANDGMLHAIRVGYLKDETDTYGTLVSGVKALFKNFFTSADNNATDQIGEEIWAYIPYNAFPYLKYLADPTYCHIYYNDLTVNLVDVSIEKPDGCTVADTAECTKAEDSWKTVLIGGMRFGGACSAGMSPAGPPDGTPANVGFSSFYALDITDPENPVPMWEFTDPDLGYATTYPGIIRTGDRFLNGRWYVAIGSGSKQIPKDGQDIDRDTTGYIYILDLKTGSLVKKIDLGHNAIVGDILAVDAEYDYKSEYLYFGTAYKETTWKGKLMAIAIPDQDLTDSWTPVVTTLFNGNHPFTASPDAVLDDKRKKRIFIGSGKYYSTVDQTDTAQQIFLSLKHDPGSITYPKTKADLDDRTNTTVSGTVTGTSEVCMFDTENNEFAMKTLVTSINRSSTVVAPSPVGWYIDLKTSPTAERVISRALAIGGLVDFLTYQPNDDPCAAGGDSYLYALGYTTGVSPENVAILHPDVTGGVTSGDVTLAKRVKLGPGSPPTGDAIVLPPLKEGQTQLEKKIQVATGVVVETKNETPYSLGNKVIHWLKK